MQIVLMLLVEVDDEVYHDLICQLYDDEVDDEITHDDEAVEVELYIVKIHDYQHDLQL